ncbi:MAG: hypothetical protein LUH36_00835, partial [Oscillospiraceae bacterium]|nr:hypothetical protein [Oscillospiraceae bacterium]
YSGVAVPQEAQYGDAAGSSAGLVQAIAEGLVAAAEARPEGQEQDMTVNVYIGGKQLTSQVVNDVNRITRATGVCPIYI